MFHSMLCSKVPYKYDLFYILLCNTTFYCSRHLDTEETIEIARDQDVGHY